MDFIFSNSPYRQENLRICLISSAAAAVCAADWSLLWSLCEIIWLFSNQQCVFTPQTWEWLNLFISLSVFLTTHPVLLICWTLMTHPSILLVTKTRTKSQLSNQDNLLFLLEQYCYRLRLLGWLVVQIDTHVLNIDTHTMINNNNNNQSPGPVFYPQSLFFPGDVPLKHVVSIRCRCQDFVQYSSSTCMLI